MRRPADGYTNRPIGGRSKRRCFPSIPRSEKQRAPGASPRPNEWPAPPFRTSILAIDVRWQGVATLLLALRPAETPTPGETGAGAAAEANRAVHHVGDRAIDTGNLVAAELIIRAQAVEPILPRPEHAQTQLLISRPSRREAALGVEVGSAALVVEPVVCQAAALPGRAIAMMFCDAGERF